MRDAGERKRLRVFLLILRYSRAQNRQKGEFPRLKSPKKEPKSVGTGAAVLTTAGHNNCSLKKFAKYDFILNLNISKTLSGILAT